MKLTSMTVSELLTALRSPEPTPGGGSAAALAGAAGASLLAMMAGLPKPNASTDADLKRLADAGSRCTALAVQLEALIDDDSAAYNMVLGAFRMPKGSDEEKAARAAGIQRALTAATEAPLQVMRRCAEALQVAPVVAELGNRNARSDANVGRMLLMAGLGGARENVEINLESIRDEAYAARVRAEASTLAQVS